MSRCNRCPCPPGLPCPATAGVHRSPHPRYCELVASRPATWGPEVLRTARADADRDPGGGAFRRIPGKLNVGFAGEAYSRCGGTETFHETLLPRLKDHGIHVVGYSVSLPRERDHARLGGIPIGHGFDAHRALMVSCDVLVVWGILDLAAHLPTPRPEIISAIHGDCSLPYFCDVIRAHAPIADAFVAVQPGGLACIPEGATARREVIANAVDPRKTIPSRPRDETRASLGAGPDEVLVVWPHRYSSEKRGLLAIEAARRLPLGWRLAMIGHGFDADTLARLAEGAPVAIAGPRDDMGDVYHAADLVLSTSESEGFGLSMAEAMLAGCPVVATRTGILVERPELARVLPVGSTPGGIAVALVDDWRDADGRASRAKMARRVVAETWGVEAFVAAWARAIRSLAPEPPLPSLARQAVGLVRAGVQALASAGAPVPPDVVAERIAICESCEFFRASDRRCGGTSGCGCYVDIKAKLRDWNCPRGRWRVAPPDPRDDAVGHFKNFLESS